MKAHAALLSPLLSLQLLLVEEKEKNAARQLLARGDKACALSALRRGKYQRSVLEKTDSQLSTLEDLVSNRAY